MKISNENYAKALLASISGPNNQMSKIARGFWRTLQKNNDHRRLAKIIDCLEEEAARQNKQTILRVYANYKLSTEQIAEIKTWAKKKYKTEIIVKDIFDRHCTHGIKIKINDQLINLTLSAKINRLKQVIEK